MTTRQWILVAAALGIGIVAQIPMNHTMATSHAGDVMSSHNHAPASATTDMPQGLAQVTFAITGMT